MTAEELKTALRELPPGPFTIHLKDGSQFQALHTDYAMTSPGGTILNVYGADRMHWIEAASIIRISCEQAKETAQG